MKITIELTQQQVKGITSYLKEGYESETVGKAEITSYIRNIVSCTLESEHEAVSDHIKAASK